MNFFNKHQLLDTVIKELYITIIDTEGEYKK